MHLQIFDLDGSLSPQTSLGDAAPWQSIRTIDLRDLGPRLRLWSRGKTIAQTRQRLADLDAKIESTITLLGSGDFHHVAALLHERIREPFTLVHFDNHPDWVRFAPRWIPGVSSCIHGNMPHRGSGTGSRMAPPTATPGAIFIGETCAKGSSMKLFPRRSPRYRPRRSGSASTKTCCRRAK